MSHIKGFFKKITGDTNAYDALSKQPIIDAELKLNLFREVTSASISGIENYLKYMTKAADLQLAEKFLECRELFKKYETKGDLLNPSISHVMGIVFGRLNEMQQGVHDEVLELTQTIESKVLKPLNDYQREVSLVKENRKELKDAYDKIEQCRQSVDKAKRDVENAQRSTTQSSRLTMMVNSDTVNKKMNEVFRLEEKVQRAEKDLDEATSAANEKYDKYTEALYKRVSDECELTSCYLEYLKIQRKYHRQVLRRLDQLIPGAKDSLATYNKKPVFGCALGEHVTIHNSMSAVNLSGSIPNTSPSSSQSLVSPVIRKLVEGMCKQGVFAEEGIFRVAGSRIKMNCILYAINAGYLEYLDMVNDYDVHCLAGVLKQYIRELPDSILCNDLYDSWIGAINTSPLPNKIEAFKLVLQKLPRINYENLRYLIKFLSKIVENSEKTKMTTTNMGICFGVSLISSNMTSGGQTNGHLSSPSSVQMSSGNNVPSNLSSPSGTPQHSASFTGKVIDMATATNVFDFLLTNHIELFPGDISFLGANNASGTGSSGGGGGGSTTLNSRHTFYHSSTKQANSLHGGELASSGSALLQKAASSANKESVSDGRESNHVNRYSVMVNDTINSPNDNNYIYGHINPNPSRNHQSTNSSVSTTNSPSNNASTSTNLSTFHVNRHIKNNSIDMRYLDVENGTASNQQTSSISSSNNQNAAANKASFPPLATQTNASSTLSLESNLSATGSSSPKQKSKKQAPAPPKTAASASAQNDSMVAAGNTSLLSTSLVESTHSLSSNSSLHNVSVSSQQRSTDAHENNVSSSNSGANIMSKLTSGGEKTESTSTILPSSSSISDSSSDKSNPIESAQVLFSRPIGFDVFAADEKEVKTASPSAPSHPPLPYPVIDTLPEVSKVTVVPLNSSAPPPLMAKPNVPRKPTNGISAQLNKFNKDSSTSSSTDRSKDESTPTKTSPEITSL